MEAPERTPGLTRATALLLLAAFSAYALVLASHLAAQRLMLLDEFFALNLLRDPSLAHAFASWSGGADSGGLLYYALLRPVVLHSLHPVYLARLFSACCYIGAAWVWWRVLTRFLSPLSAALGILAVWLSSSLLLFYIAQIRFYAPFTLFAALATWSTLRASDPDLPPARSSVLMLLGHLGLVLIHMLGLVYSALLLASLLLCGLPARRRIRLIVSGAAAWPVLLLFLRAIRSGSHNAPPVGTTLFRDVLRLVLKNSVPWPVLVLAALGLALLLHTLWQLGRSRSSRQSPAFRNRLVPLSFLPAPFVMYLAAQVGRPLGESRYFLPYLLPFCLLVAVALERILTWRNGRFTLAVCLVLLLAIPLLHRRALHRLPAPPSLAPGSLETLASGRPVVVAEEQTFFELQYYRSSPGLQFRYLLPPSPSRTFGMMSSVHRAGYFAPHLEPALAFLRRNPTFLYVTPFKPEPFPSAWLTTHCRTDPAGTLGVDGGTRPILSVQDCRVSPTPPDQALPADSTAQPLPR